MKQIKVIRRTPEAVRQFFQRPELGYQMALHVLYTQMIDKKDIEGGEPNAQTQ